MKESLQLFWKLSFFLVIMTGLLTQPSQAQISEEKITQELSQLEQALNVGVQSHDTTALKQILANEYQLTGPRFPGATSKVKWLANVQTSSVDSATIKD